MSDDLERWKCKACGKLNDYLDSTFTVSHVEHAWQFYQEHAEQARQHENLRQQVAAIVIGIATIVATIAANNLNEFRIPLGITLLALGLIGLAAALKHYERNRLHTEIMKALRINIENVTQAPLSSIRTEASKEHKRTHRLARLRLHSLWELLLLAICVLGIALMAGWIGSQPQAGRLGSEAPSSVTNLAQ